VIKIMIIGGKEISAVLRDWPKELSHPVLSKAHAAAAKPLVEREQLLAPEGPTGNLVDSIGVVKRSLKRATTSGEVVVGPRVSGRYKGYAGHLIERGTAVRRTKKGYNRGFVRSKPFARPAFAQTKTQVEMGIRPQIGRILTRAAKKRL
jgi:hypothetical protein